MVKLRRISKDIYVIDEKMDYIMVPVYSELRLKGFPLLCVTPLLESNGTFNMEFWNITEPRTGRAIGSFAENSISNCKRHSGRYAKWIGAEKINELARSFIESGFISPSYKMVREK